MGKILGEIIGFRVWVARFFGVDVYLHWSWLALMASVYYFADAFSFVFGLLLFVCVVVHEYGHALTGRYYGYPAQEIILAVIGCVARFPKLPHDKPKEEFWIASAGPISNFVIAGLLFAATRMFEWGETQSSMLSYLMVSNIVIAVFNLLPMIPMDGGRILRSIWGICGGGFYSGTYLTVRLSQTLMFILGWYGVYLILATGSFNALPLIAAYIWMAAGAELYRAKMHQHENDLKDMLGVKSVEEIAQMIEQIECPRMRKYLHKSLGEVVGENQFTTAKRDEYNAEDSAGTG